MPIRTVSDSFTRPTGTTQYSAGDSVAPASKTVTGATNASPIVIASTGHGLSSGDKVTVAAVGGNTNANGDFEITVVDDDHFSLNGSTGNSNYTSGGTVTRLLRLQGVIRTNYRQAKIVRTRLMCNLATITNGSFLVHFFTQQVAQSVDNAAWALLYANRAKYIGTITLTLATEGTGSDAGMAQDATTELPFQCASGETEIYAVITAEAGYTPSSGEQFYLEITVEDLS